MLLAAVLGVAGVVWQYIDAEQQKAIARQKADEADKAERPATFS